MVNFDTKKNIIQWKPCLLKECREAKLSASLDKNHNTDFAQASSQRRNRCQSQENPPSSSGTATRPAKSWDRRKSLSSPCLSASKKLNDISFYSEAYAEALQLTVGICRDFVCYRIKRSGLGSKVYVTGFEPAKDQALSNQILNLGRAYENLYPTLYKNISKKIGYVFDAEITLKRLYFRLATHILGLDASCFSWGRILALLCLTGAMAVDCISQGHTELVECVIKISSGFLRRHCLDWIMTNGGWSTLPPHFNKNPTQPKDDPLQFIAIINKWKDWRYYCSACFLGLAILSIFTSQILTN